MLFAEFSSILEAENRIFLTENHLTLKNRLNLSLTVHLVQVAQFDDSAWGPTKIWVKIHAEKPAILCSKFSFSCLWPNRKNQMIFLSILNLLFFYKTVILAVFTPNQTTEKKEADKPLSRMLIRFNSFLKST